MTDKQDSLDTWICGTVDSIPVPADLERRIRKTVSKRRWTQVSAMAAAVFVFSMLAALWPDREISAPAAPAPAPLHTVRLSKPVPRPLPVREVQFETEVDANSDVLVFRFSDGGSHDD